MNKRRVAIGTILLVAVGACTGSSEGTTVWTDSLSEALNGVDGTWNPQGPTAILNGQVENLQSPGGNRVVGAVHSVIAHPTNAQRLVIGATNGGLWTTDNAQTASPFNPPTWTFRSGELDGQSIGALDMDPDTPDHLIAGFGAVSSKYSIAGNLAGVVVSPDFGVTWTPVAVSATSPQTPVGRNIWGVARRGSTMVIGDRNGGRGILVSQNDGADWNYATLVGGAAFPSGAVLDLVGEPGQPNRLYATVLGVGVFRSEDAGLTWVDATGPTTCPGVQTICSENLLYSTLTADPDQTHAELAVGQNGRVFIGASRLNQPVYIGYSDDQGATWTNMDLPRLPAGPQNTVINVTNDASPMRFTMSAPHGLTGTDKTRVRVTGVGGNTNANGDFSVAIPSVNVASVTADGNPMVVTTSTAHGLTTGSTVSISGVTGTTSANNRFVVSVIDATNFTVTSCTTGCSLSGNAAYVSGGTVEDLNGLVVRNCFTAPSCPTTGNANYTIGGTLSWYTSTNPREKTDPGGQAGIHFSIAVDPTDPNIVYVGGDRQEYSSISFNGGKNAIGADDYTGNIWRGDASKTPSGTAPGTVGVGPSGAIPSPRQWAHLTHD